MAIDWSIRSSVGDDGDVLCTADGVSTWLSSDDTQSRPNGGYSLKWPPHQVLSDDLGIGSGGWTHWPSMHSAHDFHSYLTCTSHLVPFLELLLQKTGRYFTPLLCYGRHLIMGPRFDGNSGACSACFAMSLLTNVPSLRLRWQCRHRLGPLSGDKVGLVRGAIDALILLREVETAAGQANNVTVLDMSSGELRHERVVLRICRQCSEDGLFNTALRSASDLLGEFVGAIRWIGRVDQPPDTFTITAAYSEILDYRDIGGGVAEGKPQAVRKALYESIERTVTNRVSEHFRLAKSQEMPSAWVTDLESYTEEQYALPAFPFKKFDTGRQYLWLEGRRLKDGSRISLPADLVTAHRSAMETNHLGAPTSTGTAAYSSPFRAQQLAALELVERDVVTRCWYRRELSVLPELALIPELVRRLGNEGKYIRLFLCGDTEVAPVVVAAIFWKTTELGALGCGAGVELHRAALAAVQNSASMFAHRAGSGSYLALGGILGSRLPAADSLAATLRYSALVDRYDPFMFELAPDLLQARSIFVARAWSGKAVTFPSSSWPLPLRKWCPSDLETRNLTEQPDAF